MGVSPPTTPATGSVLPVLLSKSTFVVAGIFTFLVLTAGAALALDGQFDVQGNRQEGRAGGEAFTTGSLYLDDSYEQVIRFAPGLAGRLQFRNRREDLTSRYGGLATDLTTVLNQPSASLTYRGGDLRALLSAGAFRKTWRGAGQDGFLDERLDWSANARGVFGWGEWYLRYNDTASWRREAPLPETENRDRMLSAGAQRTWQRCGELRYGYTRNDTRIVSSGISRLFTSHSLVYRKAGRLEDNRLRYAVEARSRFLRQDIDLGGDRHTLLVPLSVGYVLDGTPESLDPLEPLPTPLPALIDLDLDQPAGLDIGDEQSVVREFGGDFRNLVVDFGETTTMNRAVLHVADVVRFPAFLDWRIFINDDPEGVAWTELPPAAANAVYQDWGNGRQGWLIDFTAGVAARRLKLVDVKTGPTEAVIALTELEIEGPATGTAASSGSAVSRYQLAGSLEYDARRDLTLTYDTSFDERRFDDGSRDLSGADHRLGATWRRGAWTAGGSYRVDRLESPTRSSTDVTGYAFSLTRREHDRLWSRLGWSRLADHSRELDKVTENASLDVAWQPAPALRLQQQVGHARLDDAVTTSDTRSWTVSSTVSCSPKPSLSLNLRRVNRWVSAVAGAGFTPFNDTQLDLGWQIRPLLTLSSLARYEQRFRDDWMLRHYLTWIPLPGGSVSLQMSLSDQHDSRLGSHQQGASLQAICRARPRLTLEGGIEIQEYERDGERNSPLNTSFRVHWSF